MAFTNGQKKPSNSGIKKGSTWKRTERLDGYQNLALYLKAKGVNVADRILDILMSGTLEPKDAMKGWLELAKYVYEKPKDEVKIEVGESVKFVTVSQQDIIDIVKKDPFIADTN